MAIGRTISDVKWDARQGWTPELIRELKALHREKTAEVEDLKKRFPDAANRYEQYVKKNQAEGLTDEERATAEKFAMAKLFTESGAKEIEKIREGYAEAVKAYGRGLSEAANRERDAAIQKATALGDLGAGNLTLAARSLLKADGIDVDIDSE